MGKILSILSETKTGRVLQFLVSYTKTEAEKTKSLTTYYTLARSKPISKVMILSIITSTADWVLYGNCTATTD